MVKQKVKRRGDRISAMSGRSWIALFLMAALVLGFAGTAIYNVAKSGKDDDIGAKQTTDTGVNLSAAEIGSPWNDQTSNVAIDKQETVNQWMQTQAAPGDSPIIDPKSCNDLLGAVPMFTGQANKAMLSITQNDNFATDSASANADPNSSQQSGTSMIQATVAYSDNVSGSLAIDTIKGGIGDCVKDSSLSSDVTDSLEGDDVDYSFVENKKAATGDKSAAYQITATGKDKDGKKSPLVNISVGVYYSEAQNTATIIFIRSGSEKYTTGAEDMQTILPKAAQKLESTGPQLGTKEVED